MATLYNAAKQASAVNFDRAFRWSIVYALGLLMVTCGLSFVLPKHFRAASYNEV